MKIDLQNPITNFKGKIVNTNLKKLPSYVQEHLHFAESIIANKPYNLALNFNQITKDITYHYTQKEFKDVIYTSSCIDSYEFIGGLQKSIMEVNKKNRTFFEKTKDSINNFICKYIFKF